MNHSKTIKILHLPDLHIGHPKIPGVILRDHLVKYLYPKLKDIDILNIGGDFFHSLLNMNCDAGIHALLIIEELIWYAKEYGFYIRILRGTFSHDRYQNAVFDIKSKFIKDNCNDLNGNPTIKVVDNIELEFFKHLNISMLYCPDDQPFNDIASELIKVIDSHKIKQVDFLCSHGYLDHLIPKNIPAPHNLIDATKLKPYIRGLVLNGHIHSPSVHNRCISGGSFERMNHGEEEDKGYFIITYSAESHKASYEFIKNEDAFPFLSFNLKEFNSDTSALHYIESKLDPYIVKHKQDPNFKIFVRLITEDVNQLSYLKTKYPQIQFTTKKVESQDIVEENIETSLEELPIITEANLASLIKAELKLNNISLSEEEIQLILNGDDV